ncbi:MAG: tRNA (adenosine(37)-N6)-threonylcarbamoyltransferase complex dimerization subunit type 1 TsaB [Woeseiaceae bacterium]|nr:tRNA (adenosine(37)-N6)-threonylcarbamoyltransferase complex dimerization subunit type 1 TsaB [Gammaproteobacteria bacterium]NNK24369.1 tRNA (adenosine(37)-N6)-threonylcarbamoyltransferase complex dimerization subunit type 1 TsaB [Woeseiaceae bacterium]
MKLLAMDTSSLACSVAVQSGEAVIERHEEQPREHTRLLVPMIRAALGEAGLAVEALDAIVLGNGPGSFIGMRIAASVAQGLAYGAGIRIAPVSSLAAVAAEVFASSDAAQVVVTQDAHMNEVYLGAFGRGDHGIPQALFAERLCGQVIIDELDEDAAASRFAAGAGWQRYPALLAANNGLIGNTSPVLYPRARYLLPLGVAALTAGAAVAPQDLVPAYLRARVAAEPDSASP